MFLDEQKACHDFLKILLRNLSYLESEVVHCSRNEANISYKSGGH